MTEYLFYEKHGTEIHILSYFYPADIDYRIMEYCGCYLDTKDTQNMTHDEIENYMNESKNYVGDVKENEYKKELQSMLKDSLYMNIHAVNDNTPDGLYFQTY